MHEIITKKSHPKVPGNQFNHPRMLTV